jgi:hypothetical protein
MEKNTGTSFYTSSCMLSVSESLDFLFMIQYSRCSINRNCLRLLWICGLHVSRRSKCIPRYFNQQADRIPGNGYTAGVLYIRHKCVTYWGILNEFRGARPGCCASSDCTECFHVHVLQTKYFLTNYQ